MNDKWRNRGIRVLIMALELIVVLAFYHFLGIVAALAYLTASVSTLKTDVKRPLGDLDA